MLLGFAPLVVPLAATAPRADDVPRGGVIVLGGVLFALEREEAVGLLRRSAEALLRATFFDGVGASADALRDLAKDAAVGANRLDGVFARSVDGVDVGVLDRNDGVFGLGLVALVREDFEGVLGAVLGTAGLRVEEVDVVDVPVCCGRSAGVEEALLAVRVLAFAGALDEEARNEDGGGDLDIFSTLGGGKTGVLTASCSSF